MISIYVAGVPAPQGSKRALVQRTKHVARRRRCEDATEAAARLGVPSVYGHGQWWIWWS